jgi:arylsulfatase
MPTLLEVAGLPVPAGLDGLSFATELRGERAPEHEFLFWEFHGYGGQQAVLLGRWKGVRFGLLEKEEIPSLELYDLAASERETANVASENPDVVARLLAILEREHRPSRDFPFPLLDLVVPRTDGF